MLTERRTKCKKPHQLDRTQKAQSQKNKNTARIKELSLNEVKGVWISCECLICKGHFDPTCATTVECAGIGDHETALPKSAWWHPVFVMMSSWDSTSWWMSVCDLCWQWQLAYWDLYTVGTTGSFITDTARSNTLLRNNQRCDQPTNGDLYRPAVD